MLFCVATILKVSLPTGMVLFFLLWVYRPIHTYLYPRRYIFSSTLYYIYTYLSLHVFLYLSIALLFSIYTETTKCKYLHFRHLMNL